VKIENISSFGAIIGGGFFRGVLVIKVIAVVVGLFFAGLVYLQYQQIVNINWGKLREVSRNAAATFVNATTQIPGGHIAALAMSNLGIPLTGSVSIGVTIGFLKG
jgi:uncharacterized membrane protein (Fun14 family)